MTKNGITEHRQENFSEQKRSVRNGKRSVQNNCTMAFNFFVYIAGINEASHKMSFLITVCIFRDSIFYKKNKKKSQFGVKDFSLEF